jgi:type II secretory pathway component PulJ
MIELLTATTLAVIMLIGIVTILGTVSRAVNESRAMLETADRLRAARNLLQKDLEGVTVTPKPPRRPEFQEGYFEYIEGPLGAAISPRNFAINTENGLPDDTVIDFDDILMFTTRRVDRPFIGRFDHPSSPSTIESRVAEVAWFVRGNVLYRRVLLVAPWSLSALDTNGNGLVDAADVGGRSIFDRYDISVRPVWDSNNTLLGWIPNNLGDLTNREARYAHWNVGTQQFPYEASVWGLLGLPTLEETSHPGWMSLSSWPGLASMPFPHASAASGNPSFRTDMWLDPYLWAANLAPNLLDPKTGVLTDFRGPRVGEDVVLTNVIGFDVKIWDSDAVVKIGPDGEAIYPGDPGYAAAGSYAQNLGAFVDLGTGAGRFGGPGHPKSGLGALYPNGASRPIPTLVYDSWSFFYEHDGRPQFGPNIDLGTNGFDDDNNGVVDDANEMDTLPPYSEPLRAIRVVIRVFEPDTKQIRQVSIVQSFPTGNMVE